MRSEQIAKERINMNNIFAIDVTVDKENETFDGDFLITKRIRDDDIDEIESMINYDPIVVSSHGRITFIRVVGLLFASVGIMYGIYLLVTNRFSGTAYVGIPAVILFAVLLLYHAHRLEHNNRLAEEQDDALIGKRIIKTFDDAVLAYFGVPDKEPRNQIEILNLRYTRQGSYCSDEMLRDNKIYYIFREGDNIVLVNTDIDEVRLDIPLSSVRSLTVSESPVQFKNNIVDVISERPVDTSGIVSFAKGVFTADYYLVLSLDFNGEEYQIHFPPFEEETIEKFFGFETDYPDAEESDTDSL